MRHATLLVAVLLALACRDQPEERRIYNPLLDRQPLPERTYPELVVAADWVAERQEIQPVDTRPESAYLAGHLPGAIRVSLPADCLVAGALCLQRELGHQGLTGTESLVLYDDGVDHVELGRLFWLLEWAGFQDVKVLDGGFPAWQEGRTAVETDRRQLPRQTFTEPANDEAVADLRWMEDHFGLIGIETLDLRDRGIWMDREYRAPPHFAAGHIPHSLPYDFRGWLGEAGEWPDPLGSWEVFRGFGPRAYTYIRLDAEYVVYGEGPESERLGLAYLLLRRMAAPARVFAGGFEAWTEGSPRPVVRIAEAADVKRLLERENPGLERDEKSSDVAMFDLRGGGDFKRGHLPGAVLLPSHRFAASLETVFEEHWPGVAREQVPLVLYCYGRDCIRSRDGSNFAARSGFLDIWWFRDGVDAWQAAGYPVIAATP